MWAVNRLRPLAGWGLICGVCALLAIVTSSQPLLKGDADFDAVVGISLWERELAFGQDPYYFRYFQWPLLIILLLRQCAFVANPLALSRFGSKRHGLLALWMRGAGIAALLGASKLLGVLATSSGYTWRMSWTPEVLSVQPATVWQGILQPYASRHLSPVACIAYGIAFEVGLAGLAATLLGALIVNTRVKPWIPGVGVGFVPLVLVHVWRFPQWSNPDVALAPFSGVEAFGALWCVPLFFAVATILTIGVSGSSVLVRARKAFARTGSFGYWCIATVGVATLMSFLRPDGADLFMYLTYGSARDEFSFTAWFMYMVLVFGASYAALVRFAGETAPAASLVAIRTGDPWKLFTRTIGGSLVTAIAALSLVLVLLGGVSSSMAHHPTELLPALQVWLGSIVTVVVTTLLSMAAAWRFGSMAVAAITLVVCAALTLPWLNPLWPAPFALGFYGAFPATAGAIIVTATVGVASVVFLRFVQSNTRIPQFDS